MNLVTDPEGEVVLGWEGEKNVGGESRRGDPASGEGAPYFQAGKRIGGRRCSSCAVAAAGAPRVVPLLVRLRWSQGKVAVTGAGGGGAGKSGQSVGDGVGWERREGLTV